MAGFIQDLINRAKAAKKGDDAGFPKHNYAYSGRRFGTDGVVAIPRPKFTWLVEFEFDPGYKYVRIMEETQQEGYFFMPVKSVDHPSYEFQMEKLRSYNQVVNVPVRMQYKPFSLVFHDDSMSAVAALLKQYRSFYHESGTAGSTYDFLAPGDSPFLPIQGGMRGSRNTRNFFQAINVYDLGTSPDHVNIFRFIHPTIADISHGNLDYEDGSGKTEVTLQFEYEGVVDEVGVSNTDSRVKHMFGLLDSTPAGGDDASGPRGGRAFSSNGPVSAFDSLLRNAERSLDRGGFNFKTFKNGVFDEFTAGTPIQTVRQIVAAADQVKQAIKSKDYGRSLAILKNTANQGMPWLDGLSVTDIASPVVEDVVGPVRTAVNEGYDALRSAQDATIKKFLE